MVPAPRVAQSYFRHFADKRHLRHQHEINSGLRDVECRSDRAPVSSQGTPTKQARPGASNTAGTARNTSDPSRPGPCALAPSVRDDSGFAGFTRSWEFRCAHASDLSLIT